jgi:hypothetical protein
MKILILIKYFCELKRANFNWGAQTVPDFMRVFQTFLLETASYSMCKKFSKNFFRDSFFKFVFLPRNAVQLKSKQKIIILTKAC